MENTPQKKTNWGMIILLVILIPVLLLGYKFISKKMDNPDNTAQNNTIKPGENNTVSAQNADFPSGTWYRNDPTINSKYIFDTPQNVNGKLTGQVDMIMDDQSEGKVNYEVIGDGKLRISDPQGSFNAWELGYAYNAATQSLEIIAGGQSSTFTRNPVYVYQNNTPAPVTTTSNNTKSDLSQLPPVGFDQPKKPGNFMVNANGAWSNAQGPGSNQFVMSILPNQNGSKISGEIECDFFDKSSYHIGSAMWHFNGTINGNVANINVTDLKGNLETKATLTLKGSNLIFAANKKAGVLPKNATLREH